MREEKKESGGGRSAEANEFAAAATHLIAVGQFPPSPPGRIGERIIQCVIRWNWAGSGHREQI